MRRRNATSSAATWQLTSVLLGYPDDQLAAQLPVLATETARLPAAAADPLRRFLAHAMATPTLDLARHFVETFDHKRRCCLYLTYYAHGDTRKRGVALLEFKSVYRAAGLELGPDELPDHLAVVLEYAATDPGDGRRLLIDHRAGIELQHGGADAPGRNVLRLPRQLEDQRDAIAGIQKRDVLKAGFAS